MALDETRFFLYAMPNPGVTMETLDAAIDRVLADLISDGVDAAALQRAKTRRWSPTRSTHRTAKAMLARWAWIASGDRASAWKISVNGPQRIEAVEPAAIIAAARKLPLDRRKAVTGHLLPLAETGA